MNWFPYDRDLRHKRVKDGINYYNYSTNHKVNLVTLILSPVFVKQSYNFKSQVYSRITD